MVVFELDEKEQAKEKAFRVKHCGGIIYILTNAPGLGINVIIKCEACDEEENITDYDNW